DSDATVRQAAASALASTEAGTTPEGAALLAVLQTDANAQVRAAALTISAAAALWERAEEEPSWLVLRRAGELLGRPLAEVAPQPLAVRSWPESPRWRLGPVEVRPAAVLSTLRPLGRTGLQVAPLGLSGRYRLPEAGFAEAVEAGVNLFFW